MSEKFNVADIFGENVFNDTVMKERLPKNVYKNLKLAMTGVQELSLTDADVIANAMKDWAIEKGATHYTHWFRTKGKRKSSDGIFRQRINQR